MCGYGHLLFHNIVLIIGISALVLNTWIFAIVKDYVLCRLKKRLPQVLRTNYECRVSNFAIRCLYEMHLELTICALISIRYGEYTSEMANLQWIASIVLLVLMTFIPLFLLT